MIPIDQLLNRIRWDTEFARGQFELGYFDRVENRIVMIPFREVSPSPDTPQAFQFIDPQGQFHNVPHHRIREVYKDGRRIWHRPLEGD